MLSIRGYLLHITHYDPAWVAVKDKEEPFDLATAKALVNRMADVGLNLLIVDPKDGIRYASHPELARHYTQPSEVLTELVQYARDLGLEVVIKLNFSQSGRHRHNHWMSPHHELFDGREYWSCGFDIIDELVTAAKPERFFHIGMDEDHERSTRLYVEAIKTLCENVRSHGLQPIMWNDSACTWPRGEVWREKVMAAEPSIPTDVIQVVWDYSGDDHESIPRLRARGFEVWGAPGGEPMKVEQMRKELVDAGGTGIVLTHWIPCVPGRKDELLERINTCGPVCSADRRQ